jgi:hypothetical protein
MQKTLKSNWMNHSDAAPKTFRAASNGKVFTRREKLNLISNEHARLAKKAAAMEFILIEKRKIAEAKAKREERMKAFQAQLENTTMKIKHSKGGLFLQGKNDKGHFTPAIAIS